MSAWYKLDTVGAIYAHTARDNWNGVFRLSAVLKSKINPLFLQKALDNALKNFECINVRLRNGLFWYYLESNSSQLEIEKDCNYPCRPFDINKKPHLLRLLYTNYRISVEFFHGLTDGGGGWIFLKFILKSYFELCGFCISTDIDCLNDTNKCFNIGNPYIRIADYSKGFLKRNTPKAYAIQLPKSIGERYYLTHFEFDCKKLKAVSKHFGIGIGELLLSILALSVNMYRKSVQQFGKNKTIINVSYDLRKRFGLQSMQNFFGYALIEVDGFDIESVLLNIKLALQRVDNDYLIKGVNTNLASQTKLLHKIVPRVIKDKILNLAYDWYGEKLATMSFSNYGQAAVPNEFFNYVDRLESSCGVARGFRLVESSAISFGNKTVLTLCVKSESTEFEKYVGLTINSLGLSAIVNSNR
ncbi:MAG: hypothetical protein FWF56_04750 [Firmicutes bacterium]|nr:hypothetical protein [Bacillota bacterium]MCL1953770.1 hypothetical protein [Bacillota bacterium]